MFTAEGFSAPRDPLVGQVIQGRYQIAHVIGRGAMGVVYEAQHLFIGRKVALKTMATHAASPASVQRFRREAQAAAAVGSSHVIDVLDMGQLENGSFYIVMEHLNGVDLGFAVALEQRFSVGRAVHVLGQLCDALSAIHAAGIVHRDLKPENIFLTTRDGASDFVKVLDFGVCKFNEAEAARLTATGDTIGTPLFMAPEQAQGRTDCDHRADIYTLGAILYFVLTGRAPFDAPNLPALFLRICQEPAPSLRSTDSSLSVELDGIIQRALSKDPNARFGSCSAFKAALRSLQATPDEMAATLPGTVYESRPIGHAWGKSTTSLADSLRLRRPRWFGLGAAAVGALAVSASSGAYLRGRVAESSSLQASAGALSSTSSLQVGTPAPASTAELGGTQSASEGQVVPRAHASSGELQHAQPATPKHYAPTAAALARAPHESSPMGISAAAAAALPSLTEEPAAGGPSLSGGASADAPSTSQGGGAGAASFGNSLDADVHLTKGPKREP